MNRPGLSEVRRASWLRLHKDSRNAWNHFTRHFDLDVAWSNADVAAQQKLGLKVAAQTVADNVKSAVKKVFG